MSDDVPLLVEFVKDAIDSSLLDLHTCCPAKVLSWNKAKQTVDVQPSLKVKYQDGSIESLPVIPGVPVQFPRVAKGGLKFPIAKGDQVLLVFSERSLDVWKAKGGEVDPQEGRKFNLSDAVAIPGVFSPSVADGSFPQSDLELKWGTSKMTLKEAGTFKIEGLGGDEVMLILSDLAQACSAIANAGGPTFNAAVFAALKVRIDLLKG